MVRGVVWNLIGMIVVAATMLVTIPLFLHFFGAERYGILATIWVFFGYFSILDFGMGPAIVNFLSRPDRSDGPSASGVFWTAFTMNLVVGLGIAILLVAAMLFAHSLGVFASRPISDELFDALPWLLLMLPVSLIYPILVGALDARRFFGLANANQVVATIIGQALPLIAIVIVKPTLTVAIAGSVLGRAVSATALLFFCVHKLELTRPRFERAIVRQLMSFGGWIALSSGVGLILDTADRLVIASLLGGTPAAWYAIAYNVVTRARVLPQAIARALYPQVSADPASGTRILISSARVMVVILIPTLAAGMVLIDPLCRLWIGQAAAAAVAPVARIMMLGVYANCLAYVPLVALQARGDPDRLAKIHLVETPVFLLIMYLATRYFGITGAALAWSARLMVDSAILLWMTDLKRVLYIDAMLQPLVLVVGFAVATLIPGGWVVQAVIVALVVVGWAAIDTMVATRAGASVSLVTLIGWLRVRLGARPRQVTP